ncbi:hypothetical protein [Deinococcus hopiensis]|uniref:hypothetical protein n=1 Tax=Deinococcus hopiensis TaxID=309885 RepID=UPI00111C1257|nr:hypothetical protein [Deinococcus hopiensis]
MTDTTEWPERLLSSADILHQKASDLRATLYDAQKRQVLTNDMDTSEVAREEVIKFTQILNQALAALIDLAAFDSPDREFPDLSQGFKFECQNVVYGSNVFSIKLID